MSTAIEKKTDQEVARADTSAERTRSRPYFQPRVDIFELPGELTLVADMPGTRSDSIDIHFEKGVLSIHGKVETRQPDATRYFRREYGVGDYYRTFQVSEVIDAAKISAEYTNGQLTLHLPKVEAVQPRKIKVKAK